MKKLLYLGVLLAGVLAGWLIRGRQTPPPPVIITETHTDTLKIRPDTVMVIPAALKTEINRLRGVLAGFLAQPDQDTADTCRALLASAVAALDSLKQALAVRPALRLTLSDSLLAKWPLKAVWVNVRYTAAGDSAFAKWDYRQWPAPLIPKSRLGAVFGYGQGAGGFGGLQVRLDESKALQAIKSEKGWGGALVWYIR